MIAASGRGAWASLQTKLRPFIARRVASQADADDVLQEVFLRMQKGLAALRDDERFGPWMYQIARSAIADHHRRAAKYELNDSESYGHELSADDSDQDEVEQQLASHVAVFVAFLPSPYREALTLTELQGLTQKEAAAMLGVSLSGMKSRVQRGRERLRGLFDECCSIGRDARGRALSCEPRPGAPIPNCRCK